jgi:hypothetical protein
MSKLPQISDDLTNRIRDMERRLAELEARARTGVVARQTFGANSSAYGDGATTDFSQSVSVDETRTYAVCTQAIGVGTAGARWNGFFHVDGTQSEKMFDGTVDANGIMTCSGRSLWLPSTVTVTLDIRLVRSAGSGTLTLAAGAPALVTRQFWVEDIGPR